jgi:hypothetical protein
MQKKNKIKHTKKEQKNKRTKSKTTKQKTKTKKKQRKKREKNKTENQKTKHDIIRKTFINSCYWSNLSNFNLVQLLSVHNIKKLNNLRRCLFLLKKIFFRYLLYNARLCLYCWVYVNIIKYYTRFAYLQLPMQSVSITEQKSIIQKQAELVIVTNKRVTSNEQTFYEYNTEIGDLYQRINLL